MEHYYDKIAKQSNTKHSDTKESSSSQHKCVVGRSLVALPGIGLVRMEEVCRDVPPGQTVERRAGFLTIATETSQAPVTQLYRSSNCATDTVTLVIETRLGYRIQCTADHPVREAVVDRAGRVTGMRWRAAGALQLGTLLKLRLGTRAATKPGLVAVPDANMAERIGNCLRHTSKVWTMPKAILQGSLAVQRAFVRGLFSEKAAHVVVDSEETACDVQTLMANLGYVVGRRSCHVHHGWQLTWLPGTVAVNGYLYDYVVHVSTTAAPGSVYNVYVPGPHSFICNAFVTHNTAAYTGPVTANGRVQGMSRVCSVSTLLDTLDNPETIGFYECEK